MSEKLPLAEKLPANADHPTATAWTDARQRLAGGQWYWLATARPDGRPHVVPVLAVWLDGALFFVAGGGSRKANNLAARPSCVVTVAADDCHLVVEGEGRKVQDAERLQRVADVYADKYGWQVTVRDGQFDADYGAPTAGAPPFDVYQLTPVKAFGFGVDETYSPTRWRF